MKFFSLGWQFRCSVRTGSCAAFSRPLKPRQKRGANGKKDACRQMATVVVGRPLLKLVNHDAANGNVATSGAKFKLEVFQISNFQFSNFPIFQFPIFQFLISIFQFLISNFPISNFPIF